ncbi:MAG: hypothetical protein ACYCZ2_05055 [Lutibacter sp.]
MRSISSFFKQDALAIEVKSPQLRFWAQRGLAAESATRQLAGNAHKKNSPAQNIKRNLILKKALI